MPQYNVPLFTCHATSHESTRRDEGVADSRGGRRGGARLAVTRPERVRTGKCGCFLLSCVPIGAYVGLSRGHGCITGQRASIYSPKAVMYVIAHACILSLMILGAST